MAEIRLSGVNKIYPGGTHAVHDVDLHIADGEFMIMVGPSGCAKSTILRMIAGLEVPTAGTVEIGGRVVNDVAPKDRDIAMIFQSYALYPHMTVRENMAFGLRLRRMPPGEIDQRVDEAARILGLESLLDRLPKAMSGGQRQRVAMGRAIVREPQAFLMDEPLSNLDAKLRVQVRTEIAKLHRRLNTTTVYVTHDQVEAMTLGQRICILRKGVIQQVDTPFEVYQNPSNVFVGGFIGSPGMNFMNGHLVLHDGILYLQLGEHHLPVPASVTSRLLATSDVHGRGVIVGIRPEHLAKAASGDEGALPAKVDLVEAMGAEMYAYFQTNVSTPDLTSLSDTQASMDGFVARLSGGSDTEGGSDIWLRPDMDELHLFDPQTFLTMLAPAEKADVRERQSGLHRVAVAGMQGVRSAVAMPPTAQPRHSAAVQPVQPVIHLHQTFMGQEVTPFGTLAEGADATTISAVFDQPAPRTPLHLEPLMPDVAVVGGSSAHAYAPAAASQQTTRGSHPRPTFLGAFGDEGTSGDAGAFAPLAGRGPTRASSPAPVVEHRPRIKSIEDSPRVEPGTAASEAASPAVEPERVVAPIVNRGFAPRAIGPRPVAPPAQEVQPIDDAVTTSWDRPIDDDLVIAIDAMTPQDAGPLVEMPAGPLALTESPTAFHEALARIRAQRAVPATDTAHAVSDSVLPPSSALRRATVAPTAVPSVAFRAPILGTIRLNPPDN